MAGTEAEDILHDREAEEKRERRRLPIIGLWLTAIYVVGLVLYGEPIGPLMLIGATLILGGNYLNIRAEARQLEAA